VALDGGDIDRVLIWAGATLQAPHRAMTAQRGISPYGIGSAAGHRVDSALKGTGNNVFVRGRGERCSPCKTTRQKGREFRRSKPGRALPFLP
jgi:hypothetical protein